jgi:hypothetical protein
VNPPTPQPPIPQEPTNKDSVIPDRAAASSALNRRALSDRHPWLGGRTFKRYRCKKTSAQKAKEKTRGLRH